MKNKKIIAVYLFSLLGVGFLFWWEWKFCVAIILFLIAGAFYATFIKKEK